MTLTLELSSIEYSLRLRLGKHHGGHPDFEDGIQEALIRAWKDIEAGMTNRKHIMNRAEVWFRTRMFSNHHHWTGHEPRSHDGYRKESPVREKIMAYRQEFLQLHNRYPTTREAHKATGVSESSISYHVKKSKTYSSPIVDAYNCIDEKSYWVLGYDETYIEPTMESFEETFVSDDAFNSLIENLTEFEKKVVTLRFRYGMSNRAIGRQLWPDVSVDTTQQRVNKAMHRAFKKLRESANP